MARQCPECNSRDVTENPLDGGVLWLECQDCGNRWTK